MTPDEAKEILRRCRLDTSDIGEPEVAEALALVQGQRELALWWAAEQEWQRQARSSLHELEPPSGFRELLRNPSAGRRPSVRRPLVALAMAAALVLAFTGWRWHLARSVHGEGSSSVWRQRMARVALREYRMDVVTNDFAQVMGFLSQTNSPVPSSFPLPVRELPVVGGAALRFQDRPVSMLCFDRGGGQLLWLFAIHRRDLPDYPEGTHFEQIGTLATRLWTSGDLLLLMAVQGDEASLNRYL